MNLHEDIETFKKLHPELADPSVARGKCVTMSMKFLQHVGVQVRDMYRFMRSNCPVDEFSEHHWVNIGGINVDWTARQFDPDCAYPMTWPGK